MGGLCGLIWKALFYRILCIMFYSCRYSSWSRLYESSLLKRNLTAAYLCCAVWLEVYGMMESVNVGFLYMDVVVPVGFLCMVKSR